jgi:hypothetical protein
MKYASSKANRIPLLFTSKTDVLVTGLLLLVLGFTLVFMTGCATAAMEKNTRKSAILGGHEPIAGEPLWVRDPATGGAHSIEALTEERAPVKYWFAKVFDYGVLPAAGLAGLYWTADQIDSSGGGDDNRKTYNFENEGAVTVQDGSSGASSDQSSRPSTTITTTTGTGSFQ